MPFERMFMAQVLSVFGDGVPSIMAEACMQSSRPLDFQVLRFTIISIWRASLPDPNFSCQDQLDLLAVRILSSPLAPLLFSACISSWLLDLSSYSSHSWSNIAHHLQSLSCHHSEAIRQSILECILKLRNVENDDFCWMRLRVLLDSDSPKVPELPSLLLLF